MKFYQVLSAIFLVLSKFSVQAQDEKCIPTQHGIEVYTKCLTESENNVIGTIMCILKEEKMMNDDYILIEQAFMDSIDSLATYTDQQARDQFVMGYKTCFVGFKGEMTETDRILECCFFIRNLACGKSIKCDGNTTDENSPEKCPPNSKALAIFIDCMQAEGIPNFEAIDQEEHKHKVIPMFMCVLQKAEIMDSEFVINADKLMESIDTMMTPDDNTREKLKYSYQACLVNFKGYSNETAEILECTDMMKNWACEEKEMQVCKPQNDDEESYCIANMDELQKTIVKCVPDSSDGRSATEFSKAELKITVEKNKEVLKCMMTSENMLNEDGTPSQQGFYNYFKKMLDTDPNTMELLNNQIALCFKDSENDKQSKVLRKLIDTALRRRIRFRIDNIITHILKLGFIKEFDSENKIVLSKSYQRISTEIVPKKECGEKVWECSLEFVKKICKNQ